MERVSTNHNPTTRFCFTIRKKSALLRNHSAVAVEPLRGRCLVAVESILKFLALPVQLRHGRFNITANPLRKHRTTPALATKALHYRGTNAAQL
jgi:hypothetical protein